MHEGEMLGLALLFSLCGMAWLALAMNMHWRQARGGDARLGQPTAIGLRVLGALALLASLLIYMHVDHASIAVLVWVMSLAVASLVVAFALAWRPRLLSWLVAWAA